MSAELPDRMSFEPMSEYREKAKSFLTSHALADFAKCPLLFRKKQLGLIKGVESRSFAFGRMVHTLILEGQEVFEKEFAYDPPINEKTGEPYGTRTKAYTSWAEEMHKQGKEVVSVSDLSVAKTMAAAVRHHEVATGLLKEGWPEVTVRVPYNGIACQGRLDFFSLKTGIVDLKTCDDIDWFERDAERYGYVNQMAFYGALVSLVHEDVPIHMIAVEKQEPFRVGVWRISRGRLDAAREENEERMRELLHCQENGYWPTGYEDVRDL